MISVAVVRTDNGTVVAQQTGTVSAGADPAFSFSGLLVVGCRNHVVRLLHSPYVVRKCCRGLIFGAREGRAAAD